MMSLQGSLSIEHMCRLAGVSRAGFYRGLEASYGVQQDMELRSEMQRIALQNRRRYGYRRITALLRRAGWHVGKDRAERIWRREGLKVPKRQKPRGRLWLNDGSCVRLRPQHANHVWSYDFVSAKTHDGRTVRMLNLIDEHTRESLLVRPERRWSSAKVIEYLADVMVVKGVPESQQAKEWTCECGQAHRPAAIRGSADARPGCWRCQG